MPVMRFEKVVGALPSTLTPNTLYAVRTGAGFDLYASDATGSIAHSLNAGGGLTTNLDAVPWAKRLPTPRIIGDANCTALTTLALVGNRQYFIPFSVPRQVVLSGLRISVATAVTGTAGVGIYNNTVVSGSDSPGSLLARVSGGLSTATTGDKTGTFAGGNLTLTPGILYWASIIGPAATLRALPVGAIGMALGRTANNTTAITHLYATGIAPTLPATAPTSLTAGTGSIPAIYMIEA